MACLSIVVVTTLASCGSKGDISAEPRRWLEDVAALRTVEIARVPEMPTDLAAVEDRMLVTGRQGRVFEFPLAPAGALAASRVTLPVDPDLRAETHTDGEGGLLAIEVLGESVLVLSRTRTDGAMVVELVEIDSDGGLTRVDYCSTEIPAVVIEDGEVSDGRRIARSDEPLVAFAEGPGGELFALGVDGGVFLIEEGPVEQSPPDDPDPFIACSAEDDFVSLQHMMTMDAGTLEPSFARRRGGVGGRRRGSARVGRS